jgi:ATP-binding cassette subfamily F protein uup
MSIFTLQSIKKDFGIKEILKEASFSLGYTDKIGLIGTNGSGKSTLLKMIAGLESIDSGQMIVNSGTRIVYLPQQPNLDESLTVLEQIFHIKSDSISDNWETETNAKIILTKLGVTDFKAKIGHLSGGYRKRIALATALLDDPDVLLMDEPTNHLDAQSVEWLQGYLNRFRGAILLITHDRYFLDKVTNRILEIDRGDLFTYSGNYSYYLEKKAMAEESNLNTQRKHKGLLRRELEWLAKGPKARSTKQKARIERAHALKNTEFKQAQGKIDISTVGRRIGKKVVEVQNISKGYGDRTLIKDFSYEFSPEDRIGIIGSNGAGKSTLLEMIIGRIPPDSGTVEIGSTIHIGYFDQHSEPLDTAQNQRVIDYLKEEGEFIKISDGTQISASQMLERFLFPGNQQYAPISKLSGGEKRRLFLLRILMAAPNLLILDEPTNDLDVQTLAVLEEYLEDFNGCVITVSHDRYFLDRCVDTILAIEDGGEISSYPGNYSIYLDYKKQEEEARNPKPQTAAKGKNTNSFGKPKKMSYKQIRELETLETKIPILEAEKIAIEKNLYDSPPSGFSEVQKLSQRLADLNHEIERGTERWLELSELV